MGLVLSSLKRCRANGFTLIEFLVVLGILVVVVGSALLFLSSILRGSNQATVNAEVKQNGQAVLDSLDRQIRNAADVRSLSPPPPADAYDGIVLYRSGDLPLYIVCFNTHKPTSNGWIGIASLATEPNLGDYKTVTSQDLVTGVDITDCDFKVVEAVVGGVGSKVVSVSFAVNQGVAAPSRADFLANAQFSTSISLRKY